MSRHRAIRNLNLEEELYSDEENEDYSEKSEQDILKLEQCLKNIKAKLGNQQKIPDKEIKDTLWYYYFDEKKTISYLAKEYKIDLNKDLNGSLVDQNQTIQNLNLISGQSISSSKFFSIDSKKQKTSAIENLLKPNLSNLPTLNSFKMDSLNSGSGSFKLPSLPTSTSTTFSSLMNLESTKSKILPQKISTQQSTISAAISAFKNTSSAKDKISIDTIKFPSLKSLSSNSSFNTSGFQIPKTSANINIQESTQNVDSSSRTDIKDSFKHKEYDVNDSVKPVNIRLHELSDPSHIPLFKDKSEYADFLTTHYTNSFIKSKQALDFLHLKTPEADLLSLDTSEFSHSDPYKLYKNMLFNQDSLRSSPYKIPLVGKNKSSSKIATNDSLNINNNFLFLIVDIERLPKQNLASNVIKKENLKCKKPAVIDSKMIDGKAQLNKIKLDNKKANYSNVILKPFDFESLSPDDIILLAKSKSKSMGNNDVKSSTADNNLEQSIDYNPLNLLSEVDKLEIKVSKKLTQKIDILKEYAKRGSDEKNLSLVVVGHVDSGKSTLMGRILFDMGKVSDRLIEKFERESAKIGKSSFAFAWVLDETDRERERGVTVGVATRSFKTKNRQFTLLDAPGHRDFIPNMISGASQADAAILVVDAAAGGFESGFERNGQTREHAMLVRSLGVKSLIVAVNKMETTNWSKQRFDYIRTNLLAYLLGCGFEKLDVRFIPVSGINGVNLTKRIDPVKFSELASWYKILSNPSDKSKTDNYEVGPCLIELLDTFPLPDRAIEKDLRIPVVDYFRGGEFGTSGNMNTGTNVSICGRIVQGCFQVGDTVMVVPGGETAIVKSINVDYNSEDYAIAGDNIIAMLSGVDILHYNVGSVICFPNKPITTVSRFIAQIAVFDTPIPITKGYSVFLHILSTNEPAVISRLLELVDKNTGEILKKSPRHLTKGSMALVEITIDKPVVIDLFKNCKDLGRVTLRKNGISIAAGIVTAVFSN
ncbi:hypothetical protein BB561_006402 [Smittium simulii]|uniref:Elongation factor 1 alpha-like protein n=1 Tax=Smittium simulii TaxID=133385 RepID=A0A2T9Y4N7_9FUNG|nr:hypothetical protein BB561_006402 [Smittium simulii]